MDGKLELLKNELARYRRTRSISHAADICNWLCAELLPPETKKTAGKIIIVEVEEK